MQGKRWHCEATWKDVLAATGKVRRYQMVNKKAANLWKTDKATKHYTEN